jgi:hypothetical protein
MEFVLCIRFAFTKIQTAPFTVVAQFVINPESFPEISGEERENRQLAAGKHSSKLCPRVLRLGARVIRNPRTVAGLVQPFGGFSD